MCEKRPPSPPDPATTDCKSQSNAKFGGCWLDHRTIATEDRFHSHIGREIKKARRLSPRVRMRFAHELVADQADGERAFHSCHAIRTRKCSETQPRWRELPEYCGR